MFSTIKKRSDRPTGFRSVGISLALAIFLLAGALANVSAQAIAEGFENVAGLPAQGWFSVNKSQPLGTAVWSQCSGTAIPPAQAGTANSCALVNFQSTTGTGTISNWLMAPNRTFNNGDTISFYTKTPSTTFPDRMQVRLSLAGSSTNTGTTATDVGDFTTLLLDINPTYGTSYPIVWTQFTVTISGLAGPTSGRVAFRYFVENGGPSGANSNIIGLDTFVYTPAPVGPTADGPLDYDGDGTTDYAVVRNVGGGPDGQIRWFIDRSSGGPTLGYDWGLASDFFVSGDFDGDNKDDVAVWRPGTPGTAAFYILNSATSTARVEAFGQTGDNPAIVGDYNGDGRTDIAVYRPGVTASDQSVFYYRDTPLGPTAFVPWGKGGDFVAAGDYDGDDKNDFVIQRGDAGGSGFFWILRSSDLGSSVVQFGRSTDAIVPGDYDGDGKTDIAVVRGSGGSLTWYYLSSANPGSAVQVNWGLSGGTDFPVPGDYFGNGRTDFAIWRNGTFWILNSQTFASKAYSLGSPGDYPVANFVVQ